MTDTMTSSTLLSFLLIVPIVGAVACLLTYRTPTTSRVVALAAAVVTLLLGFICYAGQTNAAGWVQYVDLPWIESLGIRFTLGLDGLSFLLVILTAFLQIAAIIAAWDQDRFPALFFALLLVLETGIIGVFLALDLILFYLCWELMLIPSFFLIGVWGYSNKIQAAVKFFLFTLAGSLCMLLAMIGLYLIHGSQTGDYTFALEALKNTHLDYGYEVVFYLCFLAAFAVKIPMFPFHSWLPDAHGEGPVSGAVDLAALLLKTGVYALVRFAFPLFPHAAQQSLPLLAVLALIGTFYAAWIAYLQTDIKRIIAYSSISHLGFVLLGLAAWSQVAWEGSMLLMINHGIATGGMFITIALVQKRTGTRDINQLGGLWKSVPNLSAFFLLFSLASLGLPGLANFSGEVLVLIGTFVVHPVWATIAVGGVLFSAVYILRMVQGTIWGPSCEPFHRQDLMTREWLLLVPFAILVVVLGCYPQPLLAQLQGPVSLLLKTGGLP